MQQVPYFLFDVLIRPFKADSFSLGELVLMGLKWIYTNITVCTNCASVVSHASGNFQLI